MTQILLATSDSDVETEAETLTPPPVKGRKMHLVWASVLLAAVLGAAMIVTQRPFLTKADTSSIVSKDSEDGICMISILAACNCANCDAEVTTESGEEKCFSTVAVKDTDDDNGDCHDYATKCNLEVGQKYTVKCSGDWDSGAKLQIGNLEFCDGTEETKTFVAEAAPIKSAQEQYEKLMQDEKRQHVVQKYGWAKAFRSCMESELSVFSPPFDEDKVNVVEWDKLESQLKEKISTVRTCDNVGAENGIAVFTACMDKFVADDAAASDGDDDDW